MIVTNDIFRKMKLMWCLSLVKFPMMLVFVGLYGTLKHSKNGYNYCW